MSTMLATLEDQVSLPGESELTDAQLMTVFGGHDHGHDHNHAMSRKSKRVVYSNKSSKLYKATSRERFGFSLDISFDLDMDMDEEEQESWND